MTDTELALMKQYEWIIPKPPIPLCQVIEALSKKFYATPLEGSDVPFLWMHQYNAFHLPKNEQLQLTAPQLKIKAIKIPITVYPGECEQEAMADSVLQVLRGEKQANRYTGKPVFQGFGWETV